MQHASFCSRLPALSSIPLTQSPRSSPKPAGAARLHKFFVNTSTKCQAWITVRFRTQVEQGWKSMRVQSRLGCYYLTWAAPGPSAHTRQRKRGGQHGNQAGSGQSTRLGLQDRWRERGREENQGNVAKPQCRTEASSEKIPFYSQWCLFSLPRGLI